MTTGPKDSIEKAMRHTHELQAFMREMNQEIAADYELIRTRALEDPGTAGDRAEEMWATLLRDWLPPQMPVVTRGRILSTTAKTSPQVDVIVLRPDYPERLRRKKVFLSEGVLAVFECKLTLKPKHVEEIFELAREIHGLEQQRAGKPIEELRSRIWVGLLAHSHQWSGSRVEPLKKALMKGLSRVDHPASTPQGITVADLGTVFPQHMAWVGASRENPDPEFNVEPELEKFGPQGAIHTEYVMWDEDVGILGNLLAELLTALSVPGISDFFDAVDVRGTGSTIASRFWPASVLSEPALRRAVKDSQSGLTAY